MIMDMIVEADKSQEWQSESWGPRRAIGVSSHLELANLRTRKNQCFSSSLNYQGEKRPHVLTGSFRAGRVSLNWGSKSTWHVCTTGLFSTFNCSDEARHHQGRLSALLSLLTHMLISSTYVCKTQNNVSPNVWAPCGLAKLTHIINHKGIIYSNNLELIVLPKSLLQSKLLFN